MLIPLLIALLPPGGVLLGTVWQAAKLNTLRVRGRLRVVRVMPAPHGAVHYVYTSADGGEHRVRAPAGRPAQVVTMLPEKPAFHALGVVNGQRIEAEALAGGRRALLALLGGTALAAAFFYGRAEWEYSRKRRAER